MHLPWWVALLMDLAAWWDRQVWSGRKLEPRAGWMYFKTPYPIPPMIEHYMSDEFLGWQDHVDAGWWWAPLEPTWDGWLPGRYV